MGKLSYRKALKPHVEVSAPKPEPTPVLEKVTCNCPEYRGSDFWNDPHRWCSRDPDTEWIWQDKERSCERTYKPIKPPEPVPTVYSPNYLGQMSQQQGMMASYYGQSMRQDSLLDLLMGISAIGRVW